MFDIKRFTLWSAGFVVVAGGSLLLLGVHWIAVLLLSAMLSALVAFIPSMKLSTPVAESGGLRGALYRPLPRPAFLSERFAGSAGEVFRAIVLVGLLAGLALSYLPSPWDGVLLAILGLLGVFRPELGSMQPWALGKAARPASLLLVIAGLFLLGRVVI